MARRSDVPEEPRTGRFTLRLASDERQLINLAARKRRQTTAAYVRRVVLESARREVAAG